MLPVGATHAPACKRRSRAMTNPALRTVSWVCGELGPGATRHVEGAQTGAAASWSALLNRVVRAPIATMCCRVRNNLALSTASSVHGLAGPSAPRSAMVVPSCVHGPWRQQLPMVALRVPTCLKPRTVQLENVPCTIGSSAPTRHATTGHIALSESRPS